MTTGERPVVEGLTGPGLGCAVFLGVMLGVFILIALYAVWTTIR